MKFPQITFSEYLYLTPDYMTEVKTFYMFAKWDGKVSGNVVRDLYQLTVEEVYTIRQVLKESIHEAYPDIVAICCKMAREQVMLSSAFEVIRALEKIVDDATKLSKMEEVKLKSISDPLYDQAAGDRMDEFGFYNWLDALTNNDRTKWEWAKKLQYRESFVILRKNLVEREIRMEYERLVRQKNKVR